MSFVKLNIIAFQGLCPTCLHDLDASLVRFVTIHCQLERSSQVHRGHAKIWT